jgi:hypothetical protein
VVEELIEPGGALDVLINNATATSLPVPGRSRIARSTVGLSIVASYAWTGSPDVTPSAVAKAGELAMAWGIAVEGVRKNLTLSRFHLHH